ncbi:DUF2242 domain-containing protein [Noviherbaspirillum sp. 1P10PC]|uniref:DUF2242 domain-containing protein n=1 Tax=Noviherbaspirillum sp. 1P10PC TaxID=3132292 RepID=UPI0039A3A21D
MSVSFRPRVCLCVLPLALLAACTTSRQAVYQNEAFGDTNTYSHVYLASAAETCEAARRALLSQGYVITSSRTDAVNGRKNFQPNGDVHAEIEFHVVCAPDSADGKNSVAFVNALQDHYALKKTNNAASVGVPALGSVSLPFTGSDDSLVKVASQTILESKFYDRFFGLVERYLPASERLSEKPQPDSLPAPDKPQAEK